MDGQPSPPSVKKDESSSVAKDQGSSAEVTREGLAKDGASVVSGQEASIKQEFILEKLRNLTNVNGSITYNLIEAVAHSTEKKNKDKSGNKKNRQESEEPTPQLDDPTRPLPRRSVKLLEIEITDCEELLSELLVHRILLLSSFDPEPAIATAYSIISHERFASYEKRALVLDAIQEDRGNLNLETLSNSKFLERKGQIILVEIDHAGQFLASLLKFNHITSGTMRDFLQDRDSILVCTASSRILKLRSDQRMTSSFFFCHRSVPFLSYALRRHFLPDRAIRLEEILREQVGRGLWQNMEDLYEQVSFYLQDGPDVLEEVVRRNEAIPRGLSTRESLDQSQPVKATDLFHDDSGVHAAALYTATYFPDLMPQDFERIVLFLLAERTTVQEKEEQFVNEKGEVQTRQVSFKIPLVDLWREASDRILQACELRAISLRDNQQDIHVMEFTLPYLRRELRSLFESRYPIFLVRMFDRLQATGLMFSFNVSPAVVDNLICLFVERAVSDPIFCNKDWLFRFVIGLRAELDVPLDTADPAGQFFQLLAKIQSNQLKHHFVTRLSLLLREMIQHDQTRKTVHDFFSVLLTSREHQAALEILLDLAQRLRFAAEFDALLWMRRLIDQGGKEMREQTYLCIFNLALGSGPRILEILETLHGWLPDETRLRDQYSPSNLYALRFLLEYSSHTILAFSEEHQGKWPCRYSLFAALPEDPDALRTRTEFLYSWLLHRDMPSILAARDEEHEKAEGEAEEDEDDLLELDFAFTDYEEVHAFLLADLTEHWLVILEGTGQGEPEARRVGDALVAALARLAPRATKSRLVRRWQWRQQEYALASGRLAVTKLDERRAFLNRRKKVFDIKQRFVASGPDRTVH